MTNKFKILYEFEILKSVDEESVTLSKDAEGNDLKTVKTIKVDKPMKFCLKRPSRGDYDNAELYYSAQVGKALDSGLISNALLAKRIDGDGGLISAPDREAVQKLQSQIKDKKQELNELKESDALYAEQKSTLGAELLQLELSLSNTARNYGNLEQSVFGITAESFARNKVIRWWLLHLLFKDDAGWKPFFDGETDNEKLESYYDFEEAEGPEKEFTDRVLFKAMLAVAYWRANGIVTDEALKELEAS